VTINSSTSLQSIILLQPVQFLILQRYSTWLHFWLAQFRVQSRELHQQYW